MKLVIFDMDGTILNTLDDIAGALNYILDKNNMPTHTSDEVKYYVGNGLHKTLERAVTAGISQTELNRIYGDFIEYYRQNAGRTTRPYEGICEAIVSLKAKGYMTAVVSNKRHEAVVDLCQTFFADMFDAAIGDRDGIRLKPEPDMVELVIKELKADKKDTIYIGDSDVDLLTAKNSGIPVIGVAWGFRGEEFLRDHGAGHICTKPEELVDTVELIFRELETKC